MSRELIRDVLRAWAVPGRNPAYHATMQQRVRRNMPVLGRALDALVVGSIGQEDASESDEGEQVRAQIAAEILAEADRVANSPRVRAQDIYVADGLYAAALIARGTARQEQDHDH